MAEHTDDYGCDECGKIFSEKDNVRTHIESCHTNMNQNNMDLRNSSDFQKNMIGAHNSLGRPYPECDYCKKTFTRKQNLASHIIRNHTGGNIDVIKCELCNITFTTNRNFKRHNNSKHNPDHQFPTCHDCNRVFKAKHSLIAHIEGNHCADAEDKLARCSLCHRAYSNFRNLKRHWESAHAGKSTLFSCPICPKTYTSNQSLRRHHKETHEQEYLKCEFCLSQFLDEQSLDAHIKSAHEKHFKCCECNELFETKMMLKEHYDEKHKTNFVCFQCSYCTKMFITEPYLRQHIKNEHSFDCFYKYCKEFLLAKDQQNIVCYNCEFCKSVFNDLQWLASHMQAAHMKIFVLCKCYVCYSKFYSKESLLEHKKICLVPSGTHSCAQCDKLFTEKSSLEFHMKVFHKIEEFCDISSTNIIDDMEEIPMQTYNCLQCDRIYNSDRSLKHHMKLKHSSGEMVECKVCGKICSNKYYLASHLKIVHTSETISKCAYCEKQFKSKRNIRRHIEYTHLGMQRYKCIDCETLFKEKRSLRKHVRTKHPDSSSFPKCHICLKMFETIKSCNIHLKIVHSFNLNTHLCDMCNVSFVSFQALDRHVRTNHLTEEELFKCEDCNEIFKGQEKYESHNRMHHVSQEPIPKQKVLPKCVLCVKDFSTRKTLRRHIKNFHKDFDIDSLADYNAAATLNVECDDCLKKFSEDFYYNIYLKLRHLKESIVFKCEECSMAYSPIEYGVQRYKLGSLEEYRNELDLSAFCTAEMSEESDGEEILLNEGVMEPESTTEDVKLDGVIGQY